MKHQLRQKINYSMSDTSITKFYKMIDKKNINGVLFITIQIKNIYKKKMIKYNKKKNYKIQKKKMIYKKISMQYYSL